MKYIFSFGAVMILALFMAGCDNSNDPAPPPQIVEIQVEPVASTLDVGTSEHYQAFATDDAGNVTDVSDQVTWSLQDGNGTVKLNTDSPGLALAVAIGTDNIVATLGQLSSTGKVTVVESELLVYVVTPKDAHLLSGTEEIFTAVGAYADGHQQDLTEESHWESEDPDVVSITASGVATAGLQGSAKITASFDGKSDIVVVVVHTDLESIDVTPLDAQQFEGGMQAFEATAIFTDGQRDIVTKDVLWRSDNTAVAVPSLVIGVFDAIIKGEAGITAKLDGSTIVGTANMTVDDVTMEGIIISPTIISVAIGETRNYFTEAVDSTGKLYSVNQLSEQSYQVDDKLVAYISNVPENKGQLTGLTLGATKVTSTFEYKGITYTSSTMVTIVPATP